MQCASSIANRRTSSRSTSCMNHGVIGPFGRDEQQPKFPGRHARFHRRAVLPATARYERKPPDSRKSAARRPGPSSARSAARRRYRSPHRRPAAPDSRATCRRRWASPPANRDRPVRRQWRRPAAAEACRSPNTRWTTSRTWGEEFGLSGGDGMGMVMSFRALTQGRPAMHVGGGKTLVGHPWAWRLGARFAISLRAVAIHVTLAATAVRPVPRSSSPRPSPLCPPPSPIPC